MMISTQDHQVRQIFLNRQHSENVKLSWVAYGTCVVSGLFLGMTKLVSDL